MIACWLYAPRRLCYLRSIVAWARRRATASQSISGEVLNG